MMAVKFSTAGAIRSLRATTRAVQVAEVRALNKTVTQARTAVTRELARDIGVTQTAIKKRLFFKKAIPGALRAAIGATRKRIPLIAMGARQTRRGVTYKSGSGRKRIDGAFITTLSNGHKGVFRRLTKKRLPIIELFGPSVGEVFKQPKAIRLMQRVVRERLPRIFNSELKFALSRRR